MLYQPNTRILVPGSWWRTWPRRSRRAGSGRRHVGSWFVAMMMMMMRKMRGLVHCLLFLYLGGMLLFRGSRQRLSGVGGALPYLVTRSRADFWRMTASASLKARGTHPDDHGEVRQQPRQNLHVTTHHRHFHFHHHHHHRLNILIDRPLAHLDQLVPLPRHLVLQLELRFEPRFSHDLPPLRQRQDDY